MIEPNYLAWFRVYELPKPQGSKKIVGPYQMADATNIAGWRNSVIQAGIEAYKGSEPCDAPVEVVIEFFLPRPKSAKKERFPAKKPDIDKLLRSTLDGITLAGIITDDSRVVFLTASKQFVSANNPPGADILVMEIGDLYDDSRNNHPAIRRNSL